VLEEIMQLAEQSDYFCPWSLPMGGGSVVGLNYIPNIGNVPILL
jgi:hypothetical protein